MLALCSSKTLGIILDDWFVVAETLIELWLCQITCEAQLSEMRQPSK